MLVGPLYGLRLAPMALANCTVCAAMKSISPEARGKASKGNQLLMANSATTMYCPPIRKHGHPPNGGRSHCTPGGKTYTLAQQVAPLPPTQM